MRIPFEHSTRLKMAIRAKICLTLGTLLFGAVSCSSKAIIPLPPDESVPIIEASPSVSVLQGMTKLNLIGVEMQVSTQSHPAMSIEALIDGSAESSWRAQNPRGSAPEWVRIDFGPDRSLAVTGVAISATPEQAKELWTRPAMLQISDDGDEWYPLVYLSLDKHVMEFTGEKAVFSFRNDSAYRYYRLFIDSRDFLSIGDLELYARTDEVVAAGLAEDPTYQRPSSVSPIFDGSVPEGLTQVALGPTQLKANHLEHDGPENLVDGDITTFWHLPLSPASRTSALQIDLGEENPLAIRAVRIANRIGHAEQLWTTSAFFQGSQDAEHWETVAFLNRNSQPIEDWITFAFENQHAFRYYRFFVVEDPQFYSLAELQLYAASDQVPSYSRAQVTDQIPSDLTQVTVSPESLQASAQNGKNGSERLLDGLTDTYWQLPISEPPRSAWLMIDVGSKHASPVTAIRIAPRRYHVDQFWMAPAFFEGSKQGNDWKVIAALDAGRRDKAAKWFFFAFQNQQIFRYYRLHIIDDPLFYSLGELQLFAKTE